MMFNNKQNLANIQQNQPIEQYGQAETSATLDQIRQSIRQINRHEKDLQFMKRLLHLIIIGYTSRNTEMTEIVNSTSLSDTLLQILQQLSPHEENEQAIISAILCSIGAMGRIKQMAFLARKEGRPCGGDFIIWGDVQQKQEDILVLQEQMKQQINSMKGENQNEIRNMIKNEIHTINQLNKDKQALQQQSSQLSSSYLIENLSESDEQNKQQSLILEQIHIKMIQKQKLQKEINSKENEREQLQNQNLALQIQVVDIKKVIEQNTIDEQQKQIQECDQDKELNIRNYNKGKSQERKSTKEKEKLNEQSEKQKTKEHKQQKEIDKLKQKQKDQVIIEKKSEQQQQQQQQEQQQQQQEQQQQQQEQIEDQIIPLKPRLLGFMFEKRVFRVSNKFIDSMNSRRFGFIAAGEQALSNIPVPGKNFRAITYDEKGGVIRLGWLEVFRWIPTKDEYRITFEVDLRDDVPSNTIRIFHEYNESPIVFVNVPKKLKIYLAHDNLPGTKYENKIFEIPKPSKEKIGEYEKVIDYNMDLPKQN